MRALTLNTSTATASIKSIFKSTFGFSGYSNVCLEPKDKSDVVVVNNFISDFHSDISSSDLTMQSMIVSSMSFAEEWDKEDDEFWSNY